MCNGYFIKSELGEDEWIRKTGGVVKPYWARERLQNEFATVQFIKKDTTIPVPGHWLFEKDGRLYLATERIVDAISADELPESKMAAATEAISEQIESWVLPQLRAITRANIGSVDPDLPVFPPVRLYGYDYRQWDPVTSDKRDAFVLCHNDLSKNNIFVDPDTFQIKYIIDWEYSGFFPPRFEIPLWKITSRQEQSDLYDETRERDLALWGLKPQDIKDCMIYVYPLNAR